jgi:nucleoside-diphosphate-sugar epimerase
MQAKPLPADDLQSVLQQAHESFAALKGAHIFITGGTGFFGHWLLESFLAANRELSLNAHVTVLTRSADKFHKDSPWIANDKSITLMAGDIRTFDFPSDPFTHIIHAATDSGDEPQRIPGAMAAIVIEGTERVFDFARAANAQRFLYLSTGAVYGRSTTLTHTPETYPLPTLSPGCYEASKQAAEHWLFKQSASPEVVIARPFAWLWTLLIRGEHQRAYNVGSDESFTISGAAQLTVETLAPHLAVETLGTPNPAAPLNSYVPSLERAHIELGLCTTVPLSEALRKTAAWHRS